jgi:acyl-CoA reductase-like NAD-dependent aldehyde dehydrogenase
MSRMAAPVAGAPTIEELIEALDPEVRAAIDDVDSTLIALSLAQSPWNRLRSATRMAQTLSRIRDAIASQGG